MHHQNFRGIILNFNTDIVFHFQLKDKLSEQHLHDFTATRQYVGQTKEAQKVGRRYP